MSFSEFAFERDAFSASSAISTPTVVIPRAILPIRRGNPAWVRDAHIGEVGGSLTKEDSLTEGREPYAAMLLREFQAMRGSLYTKKPGTLVHAENLMLARFHAAVWWRTPEKLRANMTPRRSDERLGYWVRLLNVPVQANEPTQVIRERCAAHYPLPSTAPSPDAVYTAVSDLLGEALSDIVYTRGTNLDNPPADTYWPGINPGPPADDLGHGTWSSSRANIVVQVRRPPSMNEAQFNHLVSVQLHQLLDRMLKATATFEVVEV